MLNNKKLIMVVLSALLLLSPVAFGKTKVTKLTDQKFPANPNKNLPVHESMPAGKWINVVRIDVKGRRFKEFDSTRRKASKKAAKLGAEALVVESEEKEITERWATTPGSTNWWKEKDIYPIGKYLGIRSAQ